jgi:FtsH-binding integral membrane protein
VLIVASLAAGLILGAAILTSVLPVELQRLIFHTPLLIAVLVAVTAFVLWRAATRRSPDS